MQTKSPFISRLLTLTGLLTLSATLAAAQPYTYETVTPPFAEGGLLVEITAITTLGKLAGTFSLSDLGPAGSWVWFNAKDGFRRLSFSNKQLRLSDMNGDTRSVGTYRVGPGGLTGTTGPSLGFTYRGGTLTTLKLPPLVEVSTCTINDAHDIVCTGLTDADDEHSIQAVRVKGATPGVLQTYPPGVFIHGISAARDVVGWQFDDALQKTRGYYRQASTGEEVLIDAPCGGDTEIMDINLVGTLVTVQCRGDDDDEAGVAFIVSYVFDGVHWTEIQVPGALETSVTRVNNAGQVVGRYRASAEEGDDQAPSFGFVATPAPIGDAFSAQ